MKMRGPLLAVLIVTLVAVGSLVPSSNASMDLNMAMAGMDDMDAPDCDECDGCGDLSVACNFACTASLVALVESSEFGPIRAALPSERPSLQIDLVWMGGPPDTPPPRSSRLT